MFGFVLPIGLVLAIVVVASAWNQRGAGVKSSDPMDASFDLQQSWLSTFSGVLAILGSLNLTAIALNIDPAYPFLNLFFALLVAVAPLAFKALGGKGEGTVGGFLVASAATLWAAFGVLISLGLMLNQVVLGVEIEPLIPTLLSLGVVIVALPMIAAYAHGKLSALLKGGRSARETTFL